MKWNCGVRYPPNQAGGLDAGHCMMCDCGYNDPLRRADGRLEVGWKMVEGQEGPVLKAGVVDLNDGRVNWLVG